MLLYYHCVPDEVIRKPIFLRKKRRDQFKVISSLSLETLFLIVLITLINGLIIAYLQPI